MGALASLFLGISQVATADADEALEAALHAFCAQGRAAWPGVSLDDTALAAYLGERAPPDAAPVAWIAGLRAGDLFLACACAAGVPQALRAFEATFLDKTDVYLRALRPTPELVAETQQELLEKLFVDAPGKPAKIRQYAGHGALGGWVRVAAVRTALHLLDAEKANQLRADEADALARAIVPGGDPEIELMRARYQDAFLAAFREAMRGLPRRERSLLRFTFIEHLAPARIGVMYGVHRTTVLRWIEAAEEQLLAGTRARLRERLHLSDSECDSVFALVKSRIDLRLASLLNTPT